MCEERYRRFKMKVDLPYLHKGMIYYTDYETGQIWGMESDGTKMEYELRQGLAGYIWLLIADGRKYLREIK